MFKSLNFVLTKQEFIDTVYNVIKHGRVSFEALFFLAKGCVKRDCFVSATEINRPQRDYKKVH
jgi:hypothetical protein